MTFKLKSTIQGGHVSVQLFVGPDEDHLALSGTLNFRLGEYQLFIAMMELGAVESKDKFVHSFTNTGPTVGEVMSSNTPSMKDPISGVSDDS